MKNIEVNYIDKISELEEFKGSTITAVQKLNAGTINNNFKVTTSKTDYFLRVNNVNIAGVNRLNEQYILEQISSLNISPKLIAYHSDYLILEYLPLKHWNHKNCIEHQAQLLQQLKKIHQIELPKEFPNLLLRLESYEDLSGDLISAEFKTSYQQNKQSLVELGFFEVNKLIHFDLNKQNLLGMNPTYIIDWEFAGAAHPIFDLAIFIHYHQLKPQDYGLILDYCKSFNHGEALLPLSIKLAYNMMQMWEMIQKKPSPR